ncbi:hypothetical protein R3W88_001460 [Solanum pinnatisectum]|uniref:Uncharacterized protein n=1 Tax=Solanum pinnatisectum TaxID=50273 RepID=A0AAV9MIV2_9SOLN|nr:hypothetical protein R3W88_001460 [Solanum pinnatisectum]
MSPFPASGHFSKSSVIASTYNTKSVVLIAKNNTDVESIEDTTTPKIGNINSVEANSVNEPSSITEDLVFDEIPHTIVSSNIHDMKAIGHDFEHSVSTVAKVYNDSLCKETKVPLVVLHDTYTSNNDEEENSHDNVALFEYFPPLNTSDFLVAFACQGTVMSSASSLLAEFDYSFVNTVGVTKTDRRFALTFTCANAIGLILGRSALFQNSRLISVCTRPLTFWIFLLDHGMLKIRLDMDMRILETCLLKVNVFASLGTLLLWKDIFGLSPVSKYLCSFWSASIMLILAYFHRCKSEGLDTTKPLVSRSTFLVLTRLVFSVGLREQNCTTYSIQAVVVLTIGVGIFDTGAGNDLPTRISTDAKNNCLFDCCLDGWDLFFQISSTNLVFTTTLKKLSHGDLHNTFMVLHSLRSWTKQLTMISSQRYRLENKTEHMRLPLSYEIVISTL